MICWLHVACLLLTTGASAQEDGEGDKGADWRLIFGYICFAIGAILIVFGFGRLIWWALWDRKLRKEPWRRRYLKKHFAPTYYKDPWLRESSMASVASRNASNGDNTDDTLRIDNEAIYAQPVDATNPKVPYMTSLHPGTEQELSQTESQIYGSAGNGGSRSTNSHREDTIDEIDDGVIYSVPERFADSPSRRTGPPETRTEDSESDPPAVPFRAYGNGDSESLSEADRMRYGKTGVEQDYTGDDVSYPNSMTRSRAKTRGRQNLVGPERDYSGAELGYPDSRTHIRQRNRSPERVFSAGEVQYPEASTHAHAHATRKGSGSGPNVLNKKTEMRRKGMRPRELSGRALYSQDTSKNGVPSVSGSDPVSPTTPGSVKSMKSLYQYMLSEEPLGLDREIDYTFVSSYH